MKKGSTLAVDRRTTRRYFLFRPDEAGRIEQAFWYCLAYYAKKLDILVHAALYIITDTRGNEPRFKTEFHRVFALCVKAIVGWPGEVRRQALRSAKLLGWTLRDVLRPSTIC